MTLTTILVMIAFFIFIIIGIKLIDEDENPILTIGIIGIIITPILGFWVFPNFQDKMIEIVAITPSEVVKSSTTIYIEFSEYEYKSYTDKELYDNIDTNSIFYYYKYYDKDGDLNNTLFLSKLKNKKDTIYLGKGIELIVEEDE